MSQLLLLTSPPASGKTFWIHSLAEVVPEKVLVISPLRALADECRKNWNERINVMTPEEWLVKKSAAEIVIFDEFHLLSYWGNTFRPVLWEVFVSLSLEAKLVIGLTATLSELILEEAQLLNCYFDEIIWADHGNQTLKWKPQSYVCVSKNLMTRILFQQDIQGTGLIFCRYREEVLAWEKRLTSFGFRTWSCLGGEAAEFGKRVSSEAPPDFIVATTVLSHGVNLPTITRVFLMYPVGNIDFWIQMIARGGRRGEVFDVFALEHPHGLRWSRGKNLMRILILELRLFISVLLNQLEQCFLKE
jgi:superfamily II DNA or RNA helicase